MEMTRRINVTILGRQFGLQASSDRQERSIRTAAGILNKMAEQYSAKFQKSDDVEILIFVALNICLKKLNVEEEMKNLQSEADTLERELAGYLENIDGK